ncbi:MAG: peptidase S41 [Anaerolineaceae bacterium]|nr:MAG: peptidase S41 [Anaerolineaceae bacterium]
MKRFLPILAALAFATSACLPPASPPTQLPALAVTPLADQPYQVTGTFQVSNGFVVGTYFVEHAVALTDMHGFVTRDEEWELPVHSQALGYTEIDIESLTGQYDLNLPVQPEGEFNDVDNNGKTDKGVQIFAVAYSPNLAGGPFAAGDDRSRGWPSYLASVITDPENDDEVTGGKLIVWAPDDAQAFPTGFGADGLLFTDDDPTAGIPSGYSFVNLSADPFEVTREASANFTLFEPQDVALKDFSDLSYTDAFDRMFEIVRKEYAFNGIEGKSPNWDALYAKIRPRVEQAEKDRDAQAYYLALRDFTWAFKDGHVGLGGGDIQVGLFSRATEGGYGFAIRELDNGRVIVSYVTAGGSAAGAGIQVGAQVTEFNGLPISAAIDAAESWASPQSMESSVHYQKARYLTRAPLGTTASVTFTNPGGEPQTVTLTAYAERESFASSSLFLGYNPSGLPVEYSILPSGAGYVKIRSNYDDLNLIVRLFERALKTFEAAELKGIIIDMRQNSGGAPLGLAGFLTQNEIPLGQLQYFSEATGKFENEGQPDKILPNENQYRFDKMVLLVGPACASACELEAYGFSQVPGMIVVGQFPSSGTEAEVARGQFILPDGFSLQIPTGRFVLPDGGLFLEGQGVPLTVRIPIDETTVLSAEDVVLSAAVAIISGQ